LLLLKDNVTLRLEKDAVILGSKDIDHYSNPGDDALCIKATSPLPTENVRIRNCTLSSN
jgi:polygalacturonase